MKIVYNVRESELIEKICGDFVNEGYSDCDGDTVIWEVDLPSEIVMNLRASGFRI